MLIFRSCQTNRGNIPWLSPAVARCPDDSLTPPWKLSVGARVDGWTRGGPLWSPAVARCPDDSFASPATQATQAPPQPVRILPRPHALCPLKIECAPRRRNVMMLFKNRHRSCHAERSEASRCAQHDRTGSGREISSTFKLPHFQLMPSAHCHALPAVPSPCQEKCWRVPKGWPF
jgi:hypothetical protein